MECARPRLRSACSSHDRLTQRAGRAPAAQPAGAACAGGAEPCFAMRSRPHHAPRVGVEQGEDVPPAASSRRPVRAGPAASSRGTAPRWRLQDQPRRSGAAVPQWLLPRQDPPAGRGRGETPDGLNLQARQARARLTAHRRWHPGRRPQSASPRENPLRGIELLNIDSGVDDLVATTHKADQISRRSGLRHFVDQPARAGLTSRWPGTPMDPGSDPGAQVKPRHQRRTLQAFPRYPRPLTAADPRARKPFTCPRGACSSRTSSEALMALSRQFLPTVRPFAAPRLSAASCPVTGLAGSLPPSIA